MEHENHFGNTVVYIMRRAGSITVLCFKEFCRLECQLLSDPDPLADTQQTVHRMVDLDLQKIHEIADGDSILGIDHRQVGLEFVQCCTSLMLQSSSYSNVSSTEKRSKNQSLVQKRQRTERRLGRQKRIGNKRRNNIDKEVGNRTMSGMLNIAFILEKIVHGFNHCPLAE